LDKTEEEVGLEEVGLYISAVKKARLVSAGLSKTGLDRLRGGLRGI
jgi:hypothetical protein